MYGRGWPLHVMGIESITSPAVMQTRRTTAQNRSSCVKHCLPAGSEDLRFRMETFETSTCLDAKMLFEASHNPDSTKAPSSELVKECC